MSKWFWSFFGVFLNFGPFFGLFLGAVVLTLTLIFGHQKCIFTKFTFSGPQLSRRGLVWYLLNSSKTCAPGGRPAGMKKVLV